MPLSEAQEAIRSVAPIAVVLLDACPDDPFSGGGTEGRGAGALDGDPPDTARPSPGQGRIGRADGVHFAYATAPNETASDGDGKNSPFTAALVRHFRTAGVELRTALTLVQRDDPDNKPRQRDLAINFDRIGDVQRYMGDMESALISHQAALAIRENPAALDPTNMLWQQALMVSHERMGDL